MKIFLFLLLGFTAAGCQNKMPIDVTLLYEAPPNVRCALPKKPVMRGSELVVSVVCSDHSVAAAIQPKGN